ncbi:MAG: DUF6702 family protein [Steroidobacteraceae bacterium]
MPLSVTRRDLTLALIAAALTPRIALTHRAHVTLTRVVPNASAGTWEFLHAIHYHDAAQALRRWEPTQRWQPTDPAGQARLMMAIERAFVWRNPAGSPLAPSPVGAELKGDSLHLYQEIRAPLPSGRYTVTCELLHDLFSGQRNVIQIELGTSPQRIELDARSPEGRFTIE